MSKTEPGPLRADQYPVVSLVNEQNSNIAIVLDGAPEHVPTCVYDQHQQALFEALAATSLNDQERSSLYKEQTLFEVRRGNGEEASRLARHVTEFGDKLDIFVVAMRAGDDLLVLELGDLRHHAESTGSYGNLVDYLIAEVKLGFNVELNQEAARTLMNDASLGVNDWERRQALDDAIANLIRQRIDAGRLPDADSLLSLLKNSRTAKELKVYRDVKAAMATRSLPPAVNRKAVRTARKKAQELKYNRHRDEFTVTMNDVSVLLQWHAVHPNPAILDEVKSIIHSGIVGKTAYSIFVPQEYRDDELRATVRMNLPDKIATLLKWKQWDDAKAVYEKSIENGTPDLELLPAAQLMTLYLEKNNITSESNSQLASLLASIEVTQVERSARAREVISTDIVDVSRFRQLFNRKIKTLLFEAKACPDIAQRFTVLSHLVALQLSHDTSADSNIKDIQDVMARTAGAILSSRLAKLSIPEQEVRSRLEELGIEIEHS